MAAPAAAPLDEAKAKSVLRQVRDSALFAPLRFLLILVLVVFFFERFF